MKSLYNERTHIERTKNSQEKHINSIFDGKDTAYAIFKSSFYKSRSLYTKNVLPLTAVKDNFIKSHRVHFILFATDH